MQVFDLIRSGSKFLTGRVPLLRGLVQTPKPCKFLHSLRGKNLQPSYAPFSLIKKAIPMLTPAKFLRLRVNSNVTGFGRFRVNGSHR